MKNLVVSLTIIFLCTISLFAQNGKILQVTSPDGAIVVKVEAASQLAWSVTHKGKEIIAPSAIALQLQSGEVLGADPKISSSKMEKVKRTINAINYKKDVIPDEYNQLTVRLKGDYGLLFRAYNDGVAYRLFTSKKEDLIIKNEIVNFNFTEDHKAFIPFVKDLRGTEIYRDLH
jgi:alpha-glucosidase